MCVEEKVSKLQRKIEPLGAREGMCSFPAVAMWLPLCFSCLFYRNVNVLQEHTTPRPLVLNCRPEESERLTKQSFIREKKIIV
uniref:Uncharacterized protein n=1 Tax=Anopheles dirus TaxID=7168 RepID=A0A182NY45_9DIPT